MNLLTPILAALFKGSLTKRELFALSVFTALMRNGIYSEGEAVRYADLLINELKRVPPPPVQ